MTLHDDEQRGGHRQLVGYRVEEGAEVRVHAVATRHPAIQPVGDRAEGEDQGRGEIGPFEWQVEHDHQHRDQQDAEQGEQRGNRELQIRSSIGWRKVGRQAVGESCRVA